MNNYSDDWAAIKATRSDWTITTWADAHGFWYARVSSTAGWGNAGLRTLDYHFAAMRERARRAITREIQARQGAKVGYVRVHVHQSLQDGLGVTRSITFKESGSDDA